MAKLKNTINYPIFIRRMEIRREKLGLSKKELSLAIGYSESYIGRVTNGYQEKMNLDAVYKICHVLKMERPKLNVEVQCEK